MVIMGLDCSSTAIGYSVFGKRGLEAYGVVRPQGKDWRERLVEEGKKLTELILQYRPDKIIMEDVPLQTKGGAKTLVILGGVQGFVLGIASSLGVAIDFIYPSSWRSTLGLLSGDKEKKKREALKQKAIEYVNKEFGLNLVWAGENSKKSEDDIAEAIAIAYSQIKNW